MREATAVTSVTAVLLFLKNSAPHTYNLKLYVAFWDTYWEKMTVTMTAEIERELISQRTKEALAAQKRAGSPLGRPRGVGKSKLDQFMPEIKGLLAIGSIQKFMTRRYGTTEANLSRWMTRHELKRA